MGHPIRVLCVDDDASLAELVATYLQEDYDDIIAFPETDPQAALDRVHSEEIDCVVSDYEMPGMNGIELLDEVRDLQPELPFILFTGQGSETVASDAVSAGVTDYIRKATGTEQYDLLVNRVRNAVERYRAKVDYRTIFDSVTDAILAVDPVTGEIVDVNRAFCQLWGYDEETALSLAPEELTVDGMPDKLCDTSTEKLDLECVTADGERFWAAVSVKSAVIDGKERYLAIVRDVTERHEREEALSALVGTERTLLEAESVTEICEITTDLVADALGFDAVEILLLDGEGTLRSTASVGRAPFDDEVFAAARRQVAGDALRIGEIQTRRDVDAIGRYPGGLSIQSELRVPIGDRGVIVGNTNDQRAFGSYERDLMRVLATNVAAAIDRTDREELLRERESELEDQRDELAALNHTNEVIRKINRTLVEVSSRDEIERVVCERLAAADQYRLAWIGEYDLATRVIEPKVWAGIEDGYLRGQTFAVDDYESNPFRTAVDRRTIDVRQPLTPETLPETEFERASERGYEGLTVIPITHRGTLYDVLAVYADQPDAFGERDRAVLSELGETIGYAIHSVEQRRAFTTDSVSELEFELRSEEWLLVQLSAATDRHVELDGLLVQYDGSLRVFVTVEGDPPTERVASASDDVTDWTVITETETASLYELTVRRTPVIDFLAENGATVRAANAEDGVGRLVVQLPSRVNGRELLDLLSDAYGDVDLLAQRDRKRKPQTTAEFKASLESDLTDRQHEVLRAAHHAGFFEWPRIASGEELADALGISQSTFHEHLRAGERKLFRRFFDGDETSYS
jgi:PAS domain S-box-containing protein